MDFMAAEDKRASETAKTENPHAKREESLELRVLTLIAHMVMSELRAVHAVDLNGLKALRSMASSDSFATT